MINEEALGIIPKPPKGPYADYSAEEMQDYGVSCAQAALAGASHLELLKKYMRHVRDCEGVDFTDFLDEGDCFTSAELDLLDEISREITHG